MAVLLTVGTTRSAAFKAFDCNNASAPIEQDLLLDPEPCGNMQKVHAIERDLHGEIVQIKKERLVQVTKCIVFQMITTTYCGFQSGAGVPRYVKFPDASHHRRLQELRQAGEDQDQRQGASL